MTLIRNCSAGYRQLIDLTAFLYIAEQSGKVASGVKCETTDRMSLSQENAAKGWNGRKVGATKINVIIQDEKLILRPGICGTVCGKGKKVLCCGYMNGIFCIEERCLRGSISVQSGKTGQSTEKKGEYGCCRLFLFKMDQSVIHLVVLLPDLRPQAELLSRR